MKEMKEPITVAGKMTLPADHAAHVLHPKAETAVYTVYEIVRAEIGGNGDIFNPANISVLK